MFKPILRELITNRENTTTQVRYLYLEMWTHPQINRLIKVIKPMKTQVPLTVAENNIFYHQLNTYNSIQNTSERC